MEAAKCPVTGEVCRYDTCEAHSTCKEYFSYPKLHRVEVNEAVETPTFDYVVMSKIEGISV